MNYLKILFPALMVAGALGSLIVNAIEKGSWAISLQWLGAAVHGAAGEKWGINP